MNIEIEIWFDIVCPFCYIGKRNFEKALSESGMEQQVHVTWRSFELAPDTKTDSSRDIYTYLAERKGWSEEQSRQIHGQVSETARAAGLAYNFDNMFPMNSFRAHRLLHLAKEQGVQGEVKERLLSGYFTESKNIDDEQTLRNIGRDAGISPEKLDDLLNSDVYSDEVRNDIELARQFGVQGVPFFVIDRKYAVSGAQPVEAFKQALAEVAKEKSV